MSWIIPSLSFGSAWPSSRDGRTSAAPVRAIWDIKTGKAQ
jgi:hypothetical protein